MKEKLNKITIMDSKSRSKNIKLNIYISFIFKIISIVLSFLVIPMTINYLNSEQYGIWMTLLSLLSWMSFMDIGIGNGLRNKLTESISKNDIKGAREYITTAYATISSIVIIMFLVFIIIISKLNWNKIFNTQTVSNIDLIKLVITVLCFFLLNFVISLSNQLFYAVQESALTGVSSLLLNLFLATNILILKKISSGSLIYLGLSYGIAMISSSLILTIYFFYKHNELMPNISLIRKTKINDIIGIGTKFFIIQIATIIIFTTDNMIITQVLGPKEVTSYNIAQKLFSPIIMAHTIIVTPLWSAYTEAYIKGDIQWIRKLLKKLNLLMLPIIICVVILVLLSNQILKIWIGNKVIFPKYLIMFMAVYTIISIWNNIYSYLLNGIGDLNLQMCTAIIAGIINIPFSIMFCNYLNLGNSGVILGTIVSLSIFAIIGPIRTYNILKKGEKV